MGWYEAEFRGGVFVQKRFAILLVDFWPPSPSIIARLMNNKNGKFQKAVCLRISGQFYTRFPRSFYLVMIGAFFVIIYLFTSPCAQLRKIVSRILCSYDIEWPQIRRARFWRSWRSWAPVPCNIQWHFCSIIATTFGVPHEVGWAIHLRHISGPVQQSSACSILHPKVYSQSSVYRADVTLSRASLSWEHHIPLGRTTH